MLTTGTRIKLLAFVVVAVTAVAFVGVNYAGLGTLTGGGYVVRLRLAEGGGIFTNGEVTYRGVAVGRVGELRLTDGGIEADLRIDGSAPPIPANLQAVVANRSAVGEQYVDLQPRTSGGPFLDGDSVIPQESTRLPLPVSTVLGSLSELSASVPTESLRTVVDELYEALHGTGPDLQVLLDTAGAVTENAAAHLPQTAALIGDGTTVLRTQLESAQAWREFSVNARLFAAELARSDGDLRRLIATAPGAAAELDALFVETNPELSILVANLLTTANLLRVRTAGLEQLFVVLPQAVAATSTSITADGGRLSQALTFFDPLPCTDGYGGTGYRRSDDLAPRPFDLAAGCALPAGDPRSVRGSRNAPSPGVPPAEVPGGLAGPLAMPALPAVSTTLEELLWLPS